MKSIIRAGWIGIPAVAAGCQFVAEGDKFQASG